MPVGKEVREKEQALIQGTCASQVGLREMHQEMHADVVDDDDA